ncbi:RagB/SusD family nutrient uptake outer membrane protein [Tamlana sp. 2201CG12-4]|uniref:RagB/SusD family nutrient uptake outer membrane protein n=1 Tax=Tamlana sp. 2201CG12-4 TaxID=3112582 RepID=UPI002DB95D4B|nr:RagB/SusD family nutrient uptake outer membrane protein [Tamlana sp. 2201CG12-4]MEC3907875.1 RagB/SusD family nutrient uptake outer membrane protein [Tamlana sp. 2201CG12-4]
MLKKIENTYLRLANISILVVILIAVSCDKIEEDPRGLVSSETFFKTTADMEAAVNGLYGEVTVYFSTVNARRPVFGGDDITAGFSPYTDFDVLRPVSTDGQLNSFNWEPLFSTIYKCNWLIEGYENNIANVEAGDKAFWDQAVAQAYFWRGFSYFFLVRTFGTVPLITDNEITGEPVVLSTFKEIYDQIVEDLSKASNDLPHSWSGEDGGRIDAYGAKGLLALAYLTGAGFPLGDTSYPALALATAKDVIDNSGHNLLANYADLWLGAASDNGLEGVLELQFSDTNGDWVGDPWTGNFVMGFASTPSQMDVSGGSWVEQYSELSFFNEFPAGPRKDATFLLEAPIGGVLTPWTDWVEEHPHYKKYANPDLRDGGNDFDANLYIIRFAEVLLISAEAQAMIEGGTTSDAFALNAFNMVRRRAAGLPFDTPDAGDAVSINVDDIIAERAWELASEYSRWFDMVRTQTIDETIAKRDPADNPITGPTLTESNPWIPIPDVVVQLHPGLKK